ncbi:hypothetical protein Gotur_009062 [Gossypium turneri]
MWPFKSKKNGRQHRPINNVHTITRPSNSTDTVTRPNTAKVVRAFLVN